MAGRIEADQGAEPGRYVSTRKQRQKEARPPAMQPPLTPMIDVVFQLLLFFMLACEFRQEEGLIPANLPDISGPPPTAVSIQPIRVGVLAAPPDNRGVLFRIEDTDNQWASAPALAGYLRKMASDTDPTRVPVVIKPVGPVRWEHVVNAFDQAVLAKFRRIAFAPSGS